MKTKVDIALKNVFELVASKGYTPFVSVLVGSQNYGLSTDKSDIDVKVFVVPTLKQLIDMVKISEVITTDYGQAEIKDIRLLPELLRKANPTYLELLCSQFYTDNPKYMELWLDFRHLTDDFIKAYRKRFIAATIGSAVQYYERALSNTKRDKSEYIDKPAYHVVRLYSMLNDIIVLNKKFSDTLIIKGKIKDVAFKIKAGQMKLDDAMKPLNDMVMIMRKVESLTSSDGSSIENINKLEEKTDKIIGELICLTLNT